MLLEGLGKNLNYHFIGFELNKEYCDGAEIRLRNVLVRLDKYINGDEKTMNNHSLEG
jgi:DNA modification methylase